MSAYTEYQTINLPWLKEIPAHWKAQRNKNIFVEQKEIVGEKSAEYTLLSLTLNGIVPRDMEGGGKFPESFDKYKVVRNGDMAFCLFDIDETPRTVGLSSYDGMLTGAYTIMRINNINPRYVYYYYLALDNRKMLKPLYSGLRKTININTFQSTKVPIPPREEQDQIVRFLDWKVSETNRLVNIKRKEIELLEELKKAVISHAVTKGLDNLIEMRNSGVAWLGNIPCHWEVSKVKHHFYIENGSEPSTAGDIPVYGSGAESFKTCGEYKCGPTVLLGRKGATLHIPHYVTGKYWNVDTAFNTVAKAGCKIEMQFFYYLACLFDYEYYKTQTTLPSMTQFNYKNMTVPVPPLEEQKDILQYLDYELSKIDNTIESKKNEIDCLREFKTRLISDAVTGKIDVRGIEIPEYEFVDEDTDAGDAAEDLEESEEE